MIYVDDTGIKVSGTLIPGLFKSIEVIEDAQVEEQKVEGSSSKPKQAIGYEDAKVNIELVLEDGPPGPDGKPKVTKEDKLKKIRSLFRKPKQDKPIVQEIISEQTAAHNVKEVIFKRIASKGTNGWDRITATLEFWQYVPTTIKASKKGSGQGGSGAGGAGESSGLNQDYQDYLGDDRGKAPPIGDKTEGSPAFDDDDPRRY